MSRSGIAGLAPRGEIEVRHATTRRSNAECRGCLTKTNEILEIRFRVLGGLRNVRFPLCGDCERVLKDSFKVIG